jgi:hypothetical protein
MPGVAVGPADLECQAPLPEQRFPASDQRVPGIVDVSRLGGHTVEFHDLEASAGGKRIGLRDEQIVASEEEPLKAGTDAIDSALQRVGRESRTVKEDRAAAVVSQIDEPNLFSDARDLVASSPEKPEVTIGNGDGPGVEEDQAFERRDAVACYER